MILLILILIISSLILLIEGYSWLVLPSLSVHNSQFLSVLSRLLRKIIFPVQVCIIIHNIYKPSHWSCSFYSKNNYGHSKLSSLSRCPCFRYLHLWVFNSVMYCAECEVWQLIVSLSEPDLHICWRRSKKTCIIDLYQHQYMATPCSQT